MSLNISKEIHFKNKKNELTKARSFLKKIK